MKQWLAIALTAMFLTGCSGTSQKNEKSSDPHWVVEPTIEADNIDALPMERGNSDQRNYNALGAGMQDGLSVIQRGDLYGLIDYSGNLVADCVYTDIMVGYDAKYLLEKGDEYFTLDENNKLVKLENADAATDIRGTAPNRGLCWVEEKQKLYVYGGGDTSIWEEYSTTNPVAALWTEKILVDESGWEYLDYSDTQEYVLTDGVKPVSDTKYQACGSFSDGLIAVELDGKWGYIDASGKTVIPFEYDACWKNRAYDASGGYVVLARDGKYALYDIDGNVVADFGTFEQVRPMYEGKFWVQRNGNWGVWDINA